MYVLFRPTYKNLSFVLYHHFRYPLLKWHGRKSNLFRKHGSVLSTPITAEVSRKLLKGKIQNFTNAYSFYEAV